MNISHFVASPLAYEVKLGPMAMQNVYVVEEM